MQIHNLQRNTPRMRSHQVGRGGKRGKTSGRGTKGQKARAGRKMRPEIRDFIMRLPKLRGRGKNSNKSIMGRTIVIDVGRLDKHFDEGQIVNVDALLKKRLVTAHSGSYPAVKIVSDGDLTKKLSLVGLKVSQGAKGKIEKAGGSIS